MVYFSTHFIHVKAGASMLEFSHNVPGPTVCSGSERSPRASALSGESLQGDTYTKRLVFVSLVVVLCPVQSRRQLYSWSQRLMIVSSETVWCTLCPCRRPLCMIISMWPDNPTVRQCFSCPLHDNITCSLRSTHGMFQTRVDQLILHASFWNQPCLFFGRTPATWRTA